MSRLVPEGARASTQEVRARWAYGEIRSPRFESKYRRNTPSNILAYVDNGVDFGSVDRQHWSELDTLLDTARPREYLHQELRSWQFFKCAYWSKADLNAALAIRAFNMPQQNQPLSYSAFYNGIPNTGKKNGICGTAENSDPRVAAFRTPDLLQIEAGVAVLANNCHLLVDGYLRSIIFMRQEAPDLRFAVWIPAS